jgi:zinc transport system substrate-binding protein
LKAILFLFFFIVSPSVLAKTIVVTLPPLASAIKPLLVEGDELIVLLDNNQSPHHFSLRPSHLFSVAKADLIVSVGLGIDDWAKKSIASSKASHISLATLKGVLLREVNDDTHEHEHSHHGKNQHESHKEKVQYDPHLWLDIDNLKVLVSVVAKELGANEQSWLKQLTEVEKEIASQLETYKNKPFLGQHAGFQYFNKKYQLQSLGSIQVNESGTSIKKILRLQAKIEQQKIGCIFSSPHGSEKQISALIEGVKHKVNIVRLNGLGNKDQTSVEVMKNLTKEYIRCLDD